MNIFRMAKVACSAYLYPTKSNLGGDCLVTEGFIHLERNKYLRVRPERLYCNTEPSELGTCRQFHQIFFLVGDEEDGQMLSFEEYQTCLRFSESTQTNGIVA